MGIAQITQTHGWKVFMQKLYSFGAAVVIVGALFKIMHWPGAGLMLIAGLGTEAVIFFFSAFEPLHEEIDWTLVYPELAGLGEQDEIELPEKKQKNLGTGTSGEALAKFDEMLQKAGGANLFEKLGSGLNNLNDKIKSMAEISNAAVATNEFTTNVKNASTSVNNLADSYKKSADSVNDATGKLSDAYKKTSDSLNYSVETLADTYNKASQKVAETNTGFVNAYTKLSQSMDIDFSALKDGNKSYGQQVSTLNKNLAALNAIFEMQLNEADLDKMMSDLQGSVAHSKKYNDEITKLGKRLESLNKVYGNMLAAMNVKVD